MLEEVSRSSDSDTTKKWIDLQIGLEFAEGKKRRPGDILPLNRIWDGIPEIDKLHIQEALGFTLNHSALVQRVEGN
jgi:hypothetical protein